MRRSAGDLKRLSKSLLSKINAIYIRKHNDCKHNGQKQRIDENSAGDSATSKVNPNQRKSKIPNFSRYFLLRPECFLWTLAENFGFLVFHNSVQKSQTFLSILGRKLGKNTFLISA